MKLVSVDTMRRLDAATIEGAVDSVQAIESLELMENAGRGIAEAIYEDFFSAAEKKRAVIFCGKGNNGGDGLVIARYLAEMGAMATVYLVAKRGALSADARVNFDRLVDTAVKVHVIDKIGDLPEKLMADLQIDALLGTGTKGAPRGLALDVIRYINSQDDPVCSVDDPSGLDADTGRLMNEAVIADVTYTLGLPKRGHYFVPGKEHAGLTRVIDIGIPGEVVDSVDIRENLVTPEMVSSFLPERPADAHKGTFGKLYLLSGSRGLTGAGALAAEAAMRSGVGMIRLGCPAALEPIFEVKLTETMTHGLPDIGKKGALALRALGGVLDDLAWARAAALGPGLGLHRETIELVRRLIARISVPFALDADGLTAFAEDQSALEGAHPVGVLTPHAGEFERITGSPAPGDFDEKLAAIRRAATRFNCVLVLKGSPTLIAEPGQSDSIGGQVYLNPLGNSGMATGGSGDVLTGLIGSFLAQGLRPLDAAIVGAYLHSLAGDLAAGEIGERSLIAGDLVDYLPRAFEALELGE
ncbi:MAG: NAD(P)H-hydrate dehydratase [Candidatus Zixiibacteriota bacterium]